MNPPESVDAVHGGGAPASVLKRPSTWRSIIMFLSVVGPGIITANADNDVGGITTYSLAGAQFGYELLWLLVPVTIALVVVQEMCARMGAVTGKGLADLIRENFGVKVTFWVLITFVLCDLGNTAAEFAGIASAAPILQSYVPFLTKELLVPVGAAFVFIVVTRGTYRVVEKIFLAFCTAYLAYIVSGIVVHPHWGDIARAMVAPHLTANSAYLLMAIGVIGTTISPWMQFYIQSAIVEKGIKIKDYGYSRIDVISGAIFTDVVAFFIIVATAATIFVFNQHAAAGRQIVVNDAGDAARALAPLAGKYASLLFAIGLLNAALFTASILPLSTAYYVCEAFGFESGVERRFREAPVFYSLYLGLIAIGGGLVLIPGAPLLQIIFYSQVLNGALLPVVLILMLLLINNKRLMGKYVNSPLLNAVAWTTVLVVGVLTIVSTIELIFPGIAGGGG
ncbi:MAG TPA: Nramp family divalent metal transporter [Candidatus Dormibacteraeota bacterium]|nr:Nramp family divalent metal transporter [Candidatus Dormibacteraeota bacterium]